MPQHADRFVIPSPRPQPLDQLRTELADLAFDLERQGRLDAADIVMQIDGRVRELSGSENADPAANHRAACHREPCVRTALLS